VVYFRGIVDNEMKDETKIWAAITVLSVCIAGTWIYLAWIL